MQRRQKKNEERVTIKVPENEESVTIKVPEAARIARGGERSIRNLIAAGKIPHIKFGRNIVIPRAAFMRWLDTAGGTAK